MLALTNALASSNGTNTVAQGRRPGVDLAAAAVREAHQALEDGGAHQAEDGLRTQLAVLARRSHRQLGVVFLEARREAGDEILGEER